MPRRVVQLFASTLLVSFAAATWAIEVNSTADNATGANGLCTLREALNNANLLVGGDTTGGDCADGAVGLDTITFAASTDGTPIVLTGAAADNANVSGDLDVLDALILQGNGRTATIVDGGGVDRVLDHLATGGRLDLLDLRVQGGATVDGAGVNIGGGGVADFTIDDCHIGPNVASGSGGGVRISRGTATTLRILRTTIAGNSAGGSGGGGLLLGIGATNTIWIVESTISGNTSTDSGGGIRNVAGGGGVHHLINATISGNRADDHGGGIFDGGSSEIWNVASSTITLNEADFDQAGGGEGGGVGISGPFNVRNTILAGNINVAGGQNDCRSTTDLTSLGHNLVQDDLDCNIVGDSTGNVTGIAAGLGPLASNDGPTQTHEVLPASSALDGGDPAGCTDTSDAPLAFDQRGFPRHVNGDQSGGSECDIGAFERFSGLDIPVLSRFGWTLLSLLLAVAGLVALRVRSVT